MVSVYIPLEVVRRELDSKIILATQMASKSLSVVIGGKGPVFQYARQAKKPGIFFYKATQEKYFNFFKEKKFIVAAQDEEAGITYMSYHEWVKVRPSLLNADSADLFFTWGKDEYDFLVNQKKLDGNNIVNSGSPRVSLWGSFGERFYSNEINNIKKKHEKFILISLTAPPPEDYYLSGYVSKQIKNAAETEKFVRLSNDKYQIQIISTLIDRLLEDFAISVVIRPHPSDKGTRWKRLTRTNPRIHVALDGPSTPWIHASECVIHYGSTVGIESVVAKKPTFSIKGGLFFKAPYQLVQFWEDKLSVPIKDYEDLKSKLQDLSKNNYERQNIEYLQNRLENIDNLDAVRVISNELLKLNESRKLSLDARPEVNIKTYIFTRFFYWTLFFTNRRLYVHNKYKRPRISKKYVLSKVETSREILNIKDNIKVKTLADSCFLIYKSD